MEIKNILRIALVSIAKVKPNYRKQYLEIFAPKLTEKERNYIKKELRIDD